MTLQRAVFLDKDGTLIDNVPDNVDPERIRLAIGAGAALRRLQQAGYGLIVVTNQSGVGRGIFSEDALAGVRTRIEQLLARESVTLQDFYYCPHWLHSTCARYAFRCSCRKPAPGLLQAAARAHALTLPACWMVGDILDDVEAGRRAGCRTVLIDNGNETEWRCNALRRPHRRVAHLEQAAAVITGADPWRPRAE